MRLNEEQLQKWLKNAVIFTAPAIAAFFAQLKAGVEVKDAIPFALIILWGLLADLFRKMGNSK